MEQVSTFVQDLRYAARSLRRTPAFTVAAVCTLALGIGANSAIFTLLDAVMFKPLAFPRSEELVTIYEQPSGPGAPSGVPDTTGGTGRFLRFSYPRFVRLQRALGDIGSLAAMTRSGPFAVRLTDNGDQTLIRGQLVSGNYFATAGIAVTRGRSFTEEDVQRAAVQPVAVVSDGFWKRVLGGSDAAIGRSILVSRMPVTVIGVAPPGFVGTWSDNEPDIWMPLTMQATLGYQNNNSSYGPVDRNRPWIDQDRIAWLNLFGRIPPPSRAQADARLRAENRDALVDLSLGVPDVQARTSITAATLVVEPFMRGFSGLRARFSSSLLALAAMVAIVLLIACANIANLLLARSTARAREIGIRIALGASRGRLIQQGVTESLLLAVVGGGAGFAIGQWTSMLLARAFLGSFNTPLPQVFAGDLRVLTFTAATALVTAILFGVAPSVRATKVDLAHGLMHASGRVVSGSIMRGMRPLVAVQLALSFVVVFAAGLLGRSLINFSHVDPGFSLDHVVAMGFSPRISGYPRDQLPALRDRVLNVVRAVPGVRSAVLSSCGLMANCVQSGALHLGPRSVQATQLNQNDVSAGFFSTVGTAVIQGREFTERDVAGAPRVAIVSESVARRYPSATGAIGQPIGDDEFTAEIVGVVRDTRPLSLRDAPVPMVYFALAQSNQATYTLSARVAAGTEAAAESIQRAIKAAEPALITDVAGTMNTYVALATTRERMVTYLVSALGALALLLGCVGLYGVLSYAVARRTAELGVRVALGARPADLRGIVMKDAFQVITAGILAGLAAAYWANRLIQSLVFDVGLFDPLTCLAVIALLATSALTACALPALRASRIDPIRALRTE